jgi:hypothetical protein
VAAGCGHLQPAAALYREATTHLIPSDDDGSPDTIPPKNSRGTFRVLAGILAALPENACYGFQSFPISPYSI